MKFPGSKKPEITILFVCVENAGRSQMAEGFLRNYAGVGYKGISAGTKPISQINPLAVQVMKEVGIDISNQKSKIITEDLIRNSNVLVNMGCVDKESCPILFLNNPIDWMLEDPKGKPVEKIREIRDEIERRIKELVASLKASQEINV